MKRMNDLVFPKYQSHGFPQRDRSRHLQNVLLFFVLAMVLPGLAFPATAADEPDVGNPTQSIHRIIWDKSPIPVPLTVGLEQRVGFDGEVRVGVPAEIQAVLRTQSAGGSVYWLADQPFDSARIQVQLIETGEIVLMDLNAVKKPKSSNKNEWVQRPVPIEIVTGTDTASPAANVDDNVEKPSKSGPDYVTLTRYAAQQLYAPKRLIELPEDVYRAPMPRGPVSLVRGQSVEAVPVAAWRGGPLYVTAVRLRNLGPTPVILDPRNLRGTWLAATVQHARLHPAGSDADTTAVYLISARPFGESL